MSAKNLTIIRTEDHPEANGRAPQPGESVYALSFPMENGDCLRVEMGQHGFDKVTQVLMDMLTGAPPYNDGTVPSPEEP